jgi:hypothetical protein
LKVSNENPCKFMRRLALISGMLFTLTASVWGSALAAVVFACCMNEASASNVAAPASDEHDCCRAKLGESDAPHAESTEHSPAAAMTTHEDASVPEPQTGGAHHAGMDCAGAEEPGNEAKASAAFGERGRSCLECCAGRTKQMPTTATFNTPEQNRAKRAAANAHVVSRDSFAPAASGVSHLAPSQHAPPAPVERRHVLNSVFLI